MPLLMFDAITRYADIITLFASHADGHTFTLPLLRVYAADVSSPPCRCRAISSPLRRAIHISFAIFHTLLSAIRLRYAERCRAAAAAIIIAMLPPLLLILLPPLYYATLRCRADAAA